MAVRTIVVGERGPRNRRIRTSAYELETPVLAQVVQLSAAELQVPELAPTLQRGWISAFELQTPSSDWPDNEPSGLTPIYYPIDGTDKYYGLNEPYWFWGDKWHDSGRVLVVSDGGAKYGGQCIEKRFFIGDSDGWNGTAIDNDWGTPYNPFGYCRHLYIRLVFKFSSNWDHHGSGAHKLILFGKQAQGAANNFTINARGSSGAMKIQLTHQGGNAGANSGNWYSDDNPLTLGEWHTVELLIVAQSGTGTYDGSFRMWVDDVEITEWNRSDVWPRQDLQWYNSSEPYPGNQWDGIQTFLYWGGGSGTKTANDYVRIGEVFLSGKNDTDHPNEPAGYTTITDRAFDGVQEDFDDCHYCANLEIISDPTAPESPNNVGRAKFRAGAVAPGTSLMPFSTSKKGFQYNNLYLHYWFKVSDNWQNHQTTTNKIFYITDTSSGGGGDPFYFNAHGYSTYDPDGDMRLTGQIQSSSFPNRTLDQNIASPDVLLVRGQWYEVEVLLKMNTVASPASGDGEFHMWIDGVKVSEYDNVNMSDGDCKFDNFRWEPIWGGQNDTVQEEMYQYIDHLYLSGNNNP